MPIKKCKLGFDCSLMMMCVGITAEQCENKETCGTISVMTEEEILEEELQRQHNNSKKYTFICKNPSLISGLNLCNSTSYPINKSQYSFTETEIILLYLLSRNCLVFVKDEIPFSQTIDSINSSINNLIDTLDNVNYVIPPISSEIHKYYVKRPYNTYEYIQLSAPKPIFKAVYPNNKVSLSKKYNDLTTNVHLGKEDSLKSLIILFASLNRDKLSKAYTKIKQALNLLNEALDIIRGIDSEF